MEPENLSKAKQKIARYCAYQERCQQEVRSKLYQYGLYQEQIEALIAWLITENYINEERFAVLFAGSKFRVKKWGRLKIKQALKHKNISAYCIAKGLNEIDEEAYRETILELANKKMKEISAKYSDAYQCQNKTAQFIRGKGFEPDLVWEALSKLSLT